ncbi:PA domain-containing protein [Penicillium sp. IBT 35674x]|nr:PA domain-containing protein [Penicillium sp. IBT 35674x]
MAAHLSESPILDMKATDYAMALERWVNDLFLEQSCAIARLGQAAKRFDHEVASLTPQPHPWWNAWSDRKLRAAIDAANQRYIRLERTFYHDSGLDDRPSFHHILYAAAPWHTEKAPLPGLHKSLEAVVRSIFGPPSQKWRDILTDKIIDAAILLEEYNKVGVVGAALAVCQ